MAVQVGENCMYTFAKLIFGDGAYSSDRTLTVTLEYQKDYDSHTGYYGGASVDGALSKMLTKIYQR